MGRWGSNVYQCVGWVRPLFYAAGLVEADQQKSCFGIKKNFLRVKANNLLNELLAHPPPRNVLHDGTRTITGLKCMAKLWPVAVTVSRTIASREVSLKRQL